MLIAVLPAAVLSFFLQQPIYLLCGLYVSAVIIPHSDHQSKKLAFAMLVFLFLTTLLLIILLSYSDFYFIFILSILAIIIGIIETYNPIFKAMGAYLFIGVIYTSFEMREYQSLISTALIGQQFFLSTLSMLLAFTLDKPKACHHGYIGFSLNFNPNHSLHYAVYFLPLLISMFIWHFFQLPDPQWLLWSSLSVASLSFKKSHDKITQRLIGATIGLPLGIIATLLISTHNSFIYNLSFVGIIFSLRGIKDYQTAFMTRCFFIVLFAGSHYLHTGGDRLIDVVIGGCIGLISSALLNHLTSH